MLKSSAAARLSFRLLNSVGIGALVAGGFCTTAYAQAAAGAGDVEQVVVTGSRIGTPGFTTPTPVTEITPLQYEVKQITTVVDLMLDIPSLTPNQQQSSVVDAGISGFNLRNLGATRTLTLIDGLRTEYTSVNGGYDVNSIPASLISHVDIVTGGASAGYGSDAVAGIVNVTLNTTLNGITAKAGYGQSYYGDDGTETASGAWGSDFLGGRGHIVVGGEYFSQVGVQFQSSRPWGRTNAGVIANPGCTTVTTTCAEQLRMLNVVSGNMTDGGVILSAKTTTGAASTALNFLQFGPGGVVQPFQQGPFAAATGGTYQIGGSGSLANQTMGLQVQVKRANMLVHDSYELTDDISVWTQLLYTKTSEYYPIVPNFWNGNITVTSQNAYIPASIAAIIATNKISTFVMGRSNVDLSPIDYGRDLTHSHGENYDASVGLKGKANAFGTDWTWDVSLQYDTHAYSTWVAQNMITNNYSLAVDSIANPATGGVPGVAVGLPVCRSTIAAPTNGCVPLNIFGTNTADAAAQAFIMGTSWVNATLNMEDVSANLKGAPFSTWAGPVAMAIGAEARLQSTNSVSDPLSAATAFRNGNQTPYSGHYSVEEAYFEADLPLAKDMTLARSLDIDAAVRLTSYSTSGGVTTWKVGPNWQVTDELRLRATRSHDIRAPDLTELYQSGTLRNGGQIINPVTGVSAVASGLTTGNPNLVPEIGDTITGGVIYTPSWLEGFNVSLDYWNIKMTKVLQQFTPQQTVTNCLALNIQTFCPAITYNSQGVISIVATTNFNATYQKTDGLDFEMGYNFQLDDIVTGWGGAMQLHALGTYVDQLITTGSSGIPVDSAGCVGTGTLCTTPRLRYNLSAIYLNDPWSVTVSGNWIGGGVYSNLAEGRYVFGPNAAALTAKTYNDNRVNGRFTVDASFGYQISDAWQLWGRVNNLFNTNPPLIPDTLAFQHISNTGLYDHIGGQWLVGIKLKLD